MPSANMLLRYLSSGYDAGAPEDILAHFGGGDPEGLLREAQQFDPNARFVDATSGDGGPMRRLEFDRTKLPASSRGTAGYDLRPANHGNVRPGSGDATEDEVYGSVRNSREFLKDKPNLLEIIGPMIPGLVAPYLGTLAAGAGIGGAAGLTSAVTGSGLTGVNSFNLPSWLTQQLAKTPQYARQAGSGNFDLGSLLAQGIPVAGQALGLNPSLVKGALTLGQLARARR